MKTDIEGMLQAIEQQVMAVRARMSTKGVLQHGAPGVGETMATILANQIIIMGGVATLLRELGAVFDAQEMMN